MRESHAKQYFDNANSRLFPDLYIITNITYRQIKFVFLQHYATWIVRIRLLGVGSSLLRVTNVTKCYIP